MNFNERFLHLSLFFYIFALKYNVETKKYNEETNHIKTFY